MTLAFGLVVLSWRVVAFVKAGFAETVRFGVTLAAGGSLAEADRRCPGVEDVVEGTLGFLTSVDLVDVGLVEATDEGFLNNQKLSGNAVICLKHATEEFASYEDYEVALVPRHALRSCVGRYCLPQ